MAKFYTLLALLALSWALVSAEPPRFRSSRRNGQLRFLSRQEQQAPAAATAPTESPAPYPAAGVTPEIPFDLPTETEAAVPDETYGPPDNTYGPPAAEPNNIYGPPDAEPAIEEPAAEELAPAAAGNLVAQNLIQPRNKLAIAAASRSRARSAPLLLRANPAAVPASRAGVVEIVRATPILVYTLQ